jgi:hypothetical protein
MSCKKMSVRGFRQEEKLLNLVPGSHERLTSRKRVMYAKNMGAHVRHSIQSTKGIKTGQEIKVPCNQERCEENS